MTSRANRSKDPSDLPDDPTWGQLFRAFEWNVRRRIRTCVPAKILAFDTATQGALVEVQILQVVKVFSLTKVPKNVLTVRGDPPNADAILQPLQLPNIPVGIYASNTAMFWLPILPGTTGMLHCADRSIKGWMLSGVPAEPVTAFTHALKDSVFYPTLRPVTAPLVPPLNPLAACVDAPSVCIGSQAVEPIVKGDTLIAAIDALLLAGSNAGVAVPGDGGKVAFDAAIAAWNLAKNGIKALKGKVE